MHALCQAQLVQQIRVIATIALEILGALERQLAGQVAFHDVVARTKSWSIAAIEGIAGSAIEPAFNMDAAVLAIL
jgi:hypothetical protein